MRNPESARHIPKALIYNKPAVTAIAIGVVAIGAGVDKGSLIAIAAGAGTALGGVSMELLDRIGFSRRAELERKEKMAQIIRAREIVEREAHPQDNPLFSLFETLSKAYDSVREEAQIRKTQYGEHHQKYLDAFADLSILGIGRHNIISAEKTIKQEYDERFFQFGSQFPTVVFSLPFPETPLLFGEKNHVIRLSKDLAKIPEDFEEKLSTSELNPAQRFSSQNENSSLTFSFLPQEGNFDNWSLVVYGSTNDARQTYYGRPIANLLK